MSASTRPPSPKPDGPRGFAQRWLAFDAERPRRPRLARRFALTLLAMLAVCGVLALLAAR